VTDPRQPVLDHLANLRRERWQAAAIYGAVFAFTLVMAVLLMVLAADRPAGSGVRYGFMLAALFNAWTAAGIAVSLRHHWQAILRMERATRQLLKGFELVTDRQDDPE
jgi:protein-S-isoprenylcysteine O-methyltransferase Ste14